MSTNVLTKVGQFDVESDGMLSLNGRTEFSVLGDNGNVCGHISYRLVNNEIIPTVVNYKS